MVLKITFMERIPINLITCQISLMDYINIFLKDDDPKLCQLFYILVNQSLVIKETDYEC
uniref:Uncharacterized protein n=1 Tax=Lepeophtheirus salmonis TaxID=72036 RepID=A0A0K2URZ4_LEPSM